MHHDHHTRAPRRLRRGLALGATALLLLAGCADDEATTGDTTAPAGDESTTTAGDATTTTEAMTDTVSMPTVEIVATDFAFEIPEPVPAGIVEVTLVNDGEETHHVQLAQLNEDVTMEDLQGALESGDEGAALGMVTLVGGVGTVDPGDERSAIVELEEGAHVALCFIPGEDGVPHLAKGMVAPFEVTDEGNEAEAPETDGDIVLGDYSIGLPEGFAGQGTFRVVNEGEEPHEVMFMRLLDGKTLADVGAWAATMEGPPPFTSAGGMQGLQAGGDVVGYLDLDLEDGTYVAICGIPDAEGTPHVDLGMITSFTVGEMTEGEGEGDEEEGGDATTTTAGDEM